MNEAQRWKSALAAWAIPAEILAAAPESPWGFPVDLFTQKVDQPHAVPTPSTRRALETLPLGGTVLDVGCGAGAGALPLAAIAGQFIGVDASAAMLAAFRERAEARGVAVTTIEGSWPEVAGVTAAADVVVCHNVAYNVPNLAPFLQRLTDHARRRVVLELHAEHPMSNLNDLWLHFHGLRRPTTPTADDALALTRALGWTAEREDWTAPALGWSGPDARQKLVAFARRRLCLPPARDAEIAAALAPQILEDGDVLRLAPRRSTTLWWHGTAVDE